MLRCVRQLGAERSWGARAWAIGGSVHPFPSKVALSEQRMMSVEGSEGDHSRRAGKVRFVPIFVKNSRFPVEHALSQPHFAYERRVESISDGFESSGSGSYAAGRPQVRLVRILSFLPRNGRVRLLARAQARWYRSVIGAYITIRRMYVQCRPTPISTNTWNVSCGPTMPGRMVGTPANSSTAPAV